TSFATPYFLARMASNCSAYLPSVRALTWSSTDHPSAAAISTIFSTEGSRSPERIRLTPECVIPIAWATWTFVAAAIMGVILLECLAICQVRARLACGSTDTVLCRCVPCGGAVLGGGPATRLGNRWI